MIVADFRSTYNVNKIVSVGENATVTYSKQVIAHRWRMR